MATAATAATEIIFISLFRTSSKSKYNSWNKIPLKQKFAIAAMAAKANP